MATYIEEHEFESLQQQVANGTVTLTVPREVARQFFTRVSNASIRVTTGQSLLFHQFIVWGLIAGSGMMLIACLAAVIYYFGWGATIAAPLTGIFWTVIVGLTGCRGTWVHGVIGLIVGLGLAAVIPIEFGVPVALFTVSVCLHRMSFFLAEIWVTRLVKESWHAYDMLVEHIAVTHGT
jgi:hypothetical protein